MKADHQVIAAIIIFFAGWAFGCVDPQVISLEANWPAWLSAIGTLGLLYVAYTGVHTWRRQLRVERDHDLAVRFLTAIAECYSALLDYRSPVSLLSDERASETEVVGLSQEAWKYEDTKARYRGRQRHLSEAAGRRNAMMMETLDVLGDDELGELINKLASKEAEVAREAAKLVHSLHPNPMNTLPGPDIDILFTPLRGTTPDSFGEQYESVITEIRDLLGPRIRME